MYLYADPDQVRAINTIMLEERTAPRNGWLRITLDVEA